jgi:hypothetical protein
MLFSSEHLQQRHWVTLIAGAQAVAAVVADECPILANDQRPGTPRSEECTAEHIENGHLARQKLKHRHPRGFLLLSSIRGRYLSVPGVTGPQTERNEERRKRCLTGSFALSAPLIDPVRIVRFHCPYQGNDPSNQRPAEEEVQKKYG